MNHQKHHRNIDSGNLNYQSECCRQMKKRLTRIYQEDILIQWLKKIIKLYMSKLINNVSIEVSINVSIRAIENVSIEVINEFF